jgi:hypothetical protein
MENILEKYAPYLAFYLLFCCWTPVFWFISSSMERYKMVQFEWSMLGWFDIVLGISITLLSFFAQFLLFLIKLKKDSE